MKGFTTSCFIRKSTPELRDKLKDLGYCNICTSLPCIKTDISGFLYIAEGCPESELKSGIDCGINEELFLSIAALRDDSDINQWFTDGIRWELCGVNKASYEGWKNRYKSVAHKATVEELIEHFKTIYL